MDRLKIKIMDGIDQVKSPIAAELERFETLFTQTVVSDYTLLRPVTEHLLNLSGKRMRPILTLLVAKMYGEVTQGHLAAAVIMELTHNASLVHDDVLDEAYQRRGQPTAVALLRSKAAVLVGDYLLTNAIGVGVKYKNYRAVDIAARTLHQLVEGELEQMQHALLLDTTLEDYNRVIRLKTAYLIASAAELGAPESESESMYRFGELLGEAFQIQDDIIDIDSRNSGKSMFNDFRERKITLPLIMAMRAKPSLVNQVKKHLRAAAASPKSIDWLVCFIHENQGIEQATQIMHHKCEEALLLIAHRPDSGAKQALTAYISFVSGRNY